jgi:hypothetical protein
MKFYRRIWIKQREVPAELFSVVTSLKPGGQRTDFFFVEAHPGDKEANALVDRVFAVCSQHGLKYKAAGEPGCYEYLVLPVYERSDFIAAPLLCLWTQKKMFKGLDSDKRDEQGRVVLPAPEAKPSIKIASIWPKPWIVVSHATRRVLESGGLLGMQFQEVAIKGHSIHTSPHPFWELRSAGVLPKMVNSVPDTTVSWEPPRYVIAGSYGEPHYRQRELESLGAFDIAHTCELLAGGDPALVVSQRFYQYCLRNKIPLEVRPVRIDPE